jgi:ferredoxin-NADP reductase
VHFTIPTARATKRSYSLATIHDHALGPGESVQIAVSYVAGGAATTLFEGLQRGQPIEAAALSGASASAPTTQTAATC